MTWLSRSRRLEYYDHYHLISVEEICELEDGFVRRIILKKKPFDQLVSDNSQISTIQRTHPTQYILYRKFFFFAFWFQTRTYEFPQIETYIFIVEDSIKSDARCIE